MILNFILACYGLTMILVYGKIFNKIRPKNGFFGDLFSCTLCTGFWVGIFVNFLMFLMNKNIYDGIIGNIICGFISSGTSYFLSKIVLDNGIRIEQTKNDH